MKKMFPPHHHISDIWGSIDSVQGFIERGLPNQGCDTHSGVVPTPRTVTPPDL